MKILCFPVVAVLWSACTIRCGGAPSEQTATASAAEPVLTLEADKPSHAVPPMFFGLMTEEINHSWDGGIYAELIQNRIFKDDSKTPAHWSVEPRGAGKTTISLDESLPIKDTVLTTCLKLG